MVDHEGRHARSKSCFQVFGGAILLLFFKSYAFGIIAIEENQCGKIGSLAPGSFEGFEGIKLLVPRQKTVMFRNTVLVQQGCLLAHFFECHYKCSP